MRGTWQTTGGTGGGGAAVVLGIVAGVVLLSGAGAAVATAVTDLLITAAVTVGVLVVAAAVTIPLVVRRTRRLDAEVTDARTARERALEDRRAAVAARRHQEALELAAAGRPPAPVVNVTVDPAALLAAAWNAQSQYTAQQQPAPVVRGQVEQ
jgi:hypothetical protein